MNSGDLVGSWPWCDERINVLTDISQRQPTASSSAAKLIDGLYKTEMEIKLFVVWFEDNSGH